MLAIRYIEVGVFRVEVKFVEVVTAPQRWVWFSLLLCLAKLAMQEHIVALLCLTVLHREAIADEFAQADLIKDRASGD